MEYVIKNTLVIDDQLARIGNITLHRLTYMLQIVIEVT